MPSYAVTGTSRGLGLGFVKTLSADPRNTVFAIVRSVTSAGELQKFVEDSIHKNTHIIEADNNDIQGIKAWLTLFIGFTVSDGASLMAYERASLTIDAFPSEETLEEDLLHYFKTNTLGPIHTINAFVPLLRKGDLKKCIVISTTAGSPRVAAETSFAHFVGYGISKAGVNLATAKYAARFKDEGIIFLAVTPGMVKTMPGTEEEVNKVLEPIAQKLRARYPHFEGPITVEQSVNDVLALIDRVTISESGSFVHRDGRDGDSV
ncbi:NAD-binding protein [Schizopora paradoxa]|uniref:NAD-binding protein n=1 Tax=Schizopora paradoxa TaxID=27342 RepID=A0A0H2RWC9_9AGAM|nr:NAD-binding protein [Schizopora paradoxa]